MFTPLRDIVDTTQPDPSTASNILELPQPHVFCANANDEKQPMMPTTHGGWEPFVWQGKKTLLGQFAGWSKDTSRDQSACREVSRINPTT